MQSAGLQGKTKIARLLGPLSINISLKLALVYSWQTPQEHQKSRIRSNHSSEIGKKSLLIEQ